jgi:phenylacetate-CoA ligase
MEGSLLEVVDPAGKPCRPGETGHVIITPIFQTAQPLIRYDQGDLATLGGPCTCGRHSQTLETVVGRSISVFTHPSGSAKVVTNLPDQVGMLLQSAALQLAQTGPNTYEVRYEPLDWDHISDEAAVAALVRRELWEDSAIGFVRRDKPMGATDKLLEFVNEWDATVLAES